VKTKDIYFKIYDMWNRGYASKANKLLEYSQYWERERIEEFQKNRLFELIDHASRNIPYYQRIIRKAPNKDWDYRDMMKYFQNIPVLTKKDLQSNFEELINPDINKKTLIYQHSGGTSGHPIQFYHDREKLDFTRVALQRNFDWAGYTLRKSCLKLASGQYEDTINKGIKGKIKNLLFNRYFYEGGVLANDFWASEVLDIIRKKRIKVIWGYASIIYLLARELADEKDLGIETIITSSETLLASQREKIEKTFQCKVFNDYGSREFMIAAECEMHEGFHINEEILFVEILDDEYSPCKPGESGNIIITDFYNKSFPFIRYQIGDRGAFYENETQCQCGRTLKRLKQLDGRSSEKIEVGGIKFAHTLFPEYFKTVSNVEAFQVLVFKDAISINVILYDDSQTETIENIENHFKQRLNGKIPVRIIPVKNLIREKNGKVLIIKKMD
jgi:phenylacetate-CoA ligase